MALTLRLHTIVLAVLMIVYSDMQCTHKQSPKTTQNSTKTNKTRQAKQTVFHKAIQNKIAGIICPWVLQYTEDSCDMQSGVSGRVDVRQCLPYCLRLSQQPGMLCRPQHVGCPLCTNAQSCHCCNLCVGSHESYMTAEPMHQPVAAASLAG